ncbi:uncharacterized protein KY384_002960 [Bacidia gigantensis]|uniref:uncharacterized protein n=1 Tax=Bacidia gigantensis TaxID=2732470 RepID=UPI001D03D9E1|nr:uncharacterized protein KY384_002960 [Bacidia gigantensis]KAG8531331.1 hypothetical protein KY384_002960 [Bacidia gigantensis]
MGLALADTPDEDEFGDVDDQDFLTAEKSNPSFAIPKTILSKYWNFADFRLKQANAISRLLSGNSAVVVFPTGGGKSLVYQIPALSFDEYDIQCGRPAGKGVTLVVSPLIALMKDQVDMLRKRGISAAAMDSSQSRESWLDASEKLRNGTLKLL